MKHYRSNENMCAIRKCLFCLLKPFRLKDHQFTAASTRIESCHIKVSSELHGKYYGFGVKLGDLEDSTVVQVDNLMFSIPEDLTTVKVLLNCESNRQEHLKWNMKNEARLLQMYNQGERADLMKKEHQNDTIGYGVRAKADIAAFTVLGRYPGPTLSKQEAAERMQSCEKSARYMMDCKNGIWIDGSEEKDSLVVFINDGAGNTANCLLQSIQTDAVSKAAPFIVAKRDIMNGEYLLYDYGLRTYDWRYGRKHLEQSNETASEKVEKSSTVMKKKKKYHTGVDIRYTPASRNFEGGRLPPLGDRKPLAELILAVVTAEELNPRPDFQKKMTHAAKGCSKNARYFCQDCGDRFTYYARHICKGRARDGGKVANRGLRYCPVCRDHRGLLTDLPGHLRDKHGLHRDVAAKISKSYRTILLRYNSGHLKLNNSAVSIECNDSPISNNSKESSENSESMLSCEAQTAEPLDEQREQELFNNSLLPSTAVMTSGESNISSSNAVERDLQFGQSNPENDRRRLQRKRRQPSSCNTINESDQIDDRADHLESSSGNFTENCQTSAITRTVLSSSGPRPKKQIRNATTIDPDWSEPNENKVRSTKFTVIRKKRPKRKTGKKRTDQIIDQQEYLLETLRSKAEKAMCSELQISDLEEPEKPVFQLMDDLGDIPVMRHNEAEKTMNSVFMFSESEQTQVLRENGG